MLRTRALSAIVLVAVLGVALWLGLAAIAVVLVVVAVFAAIASSHSTHGVSS